MSTVNHVWQLCAFKNVGVGAVTATTSVFFFFGGGSYFCILSISISLLLFWLFDCYCWLMPALMIGIVQLLMSGGWLLVVVAGRNLTYDRPHPTGTGTGTGIGTVIGNDTANDTGSSLGVIPPLQATPGIRPQTHSHSALRTPYSCQLTH